MDIRILSISELAVAAESIGHIKEEVVHQLRMIISNKQQIYKDSETKRTNILRRNRDGKR